MTHRLRYGDDHEVQFELPDQILLADCDAPQGATGPELQTLVERAMDDPLDFPPLHQAAVPGDRIVVALDHGVPQASQIVAAVIRYLSARGAEPRDFRVLYTRADVEAGREDPRSALPEDIRDQVALEVHDPGNRAGLSYLATNAEGKAVYLNRSLSEADLVIPVGCIRPRNALAYHGVHEAVFPTFSDQETMDRYRAADAKRSKSQRQERERESNEAGWLLGVMVTIQVVPGAGSSVLHVVAGVPGSVFERGRNLYNQAWNHGVPRRASLVVAAIEGAQSEQTWENVARALAAASRAVEDDGAIALCTDLQTAPGPSLREAGEVHDLHDALRRIRRSGHADMVPATQLARTLNRTKVYFLSQLEEETVEELGMAPVSDAEDIARLATRVDSCILLACAQYATATPEAD